ncbi:major facilitator superfamily transporter domain-containing protein 5 [Nannizzia gypsea CBS 118893]|uniref:Molybdate-anion transporter n=1 Tax=Arthroderma gypseum (strain ATCC MYA-4604 / CBS 118893) TaxID=535722 RepID=E4UV92_ARTGP|nr:major facilitator superfamily transporter domain-containing protein 5 [Nannizzia gypsea CBS 118893]EFR02219.1 major facilitator superfamily transporter domain-containing protein 5 [Nannizzia gypsea CBS 118893]
MCITDIYTGTLSTLILANVALASYRLNNNEGRASLQGLAGSVAGLFRDQTSGPQDNKGLVLTFLPVYVLVVASDWMQGPYFFPLYKETLQLHDHVIATLFATGFVSGAFSASFVGKLADVYGRRKACLAFCLIYSLSCIMTTSSSNVFILFLGRVLGGIGTTLLFTVFEAWLVAEYHHRKAANDPAELNQILGTMTVLSGMVAVLSGLVSNYLVSITGSRRAPFLASPVCLLLAFFLILGTWNENYLGNSDGSVSEATEGQQSARISTIIRDTRIMTLGFTTMITEGSMYLFVAFWSPAIIAASKDDGMSNSPPFGVIFASFMTAMMLGSQVASQLMVSPPSREDSPPAPSSSSSSSPSPEPRGYPSYDVNSISVSRSSRLLTILLFLGSMSLICAVVFPTTLLTLFAFCVYEFSIGLYYPNMGVLKSVMIQDKDRAGIYALFRLPLNCFVVAGLAFTTEGETCVPG